MASGSEVADQGFVPRGAVGGRLVFVDVVKVVAIVVVVAHHAGQAYGPGAAEWAVDDAAVAEWLDAFFRVNAAFGMGLMFLIAGYFVPGSYDRKGGRLFLSQRWQRIGIPMVILLLALHLPVAYVMSVTNPSLGGFVVSLYDTGLKSPYFHLWFLAHLLLYSLGYVLLRRYWERRGRHTSPAWAVPSHTALVGFVVALALVTWVVRIPFPIDVWRPIFFVVASEPAHLPQYVALFVVGVMAYRGDWLRRLPDRVGMIWLGIGVAASVGMYCLVLLAPQRGEQVLDRGGFTAASLLYCAWESVICVGMCIGILVAGRAVVGGANRFLLAMSAAAYAAYMIHLGLVLLIQAALLDVDASAGAKFLVVAVLGVVLSFGIAYVSRWVPGLRRLLGTAPERRAASSDLQGASG